MRQAGSLCGYGQLSDKLCKFIFGLNGEHMRTELLKTHVKPDKSAKTLSDVVAEARAIESVTQANQLIAGSAKGAEEEVHSLRHSQMKFRREPGTCFWCGDRRGPHPWKACPANGRSCSNCGGNDHFARVCLEDRKAQVPTTNNSWKRQTRRRQSTSDRGSNQRTRGGEPRSKSRDIHYTDSNVAQLQEQSYGMAYDTQYGLQYALDAEIHNVNAATRPRSQAKRYFTTLSLSTTGSTFQQAKFQIDTAATCNTMFHTTLRSLLPDAQNQSVSISSIPLWKLQATPTDRPS